MRLTHVALTNVRNYEMLHFEPAARLNVFTGSNAQGKSNLLEAIALLGTGKSFRTNSESDLIRAGTARATIAGRAEVQAGSVELGCTIGAGSSGTRKRYTVNGRNVRYAKFLGSLRVVTFVPADLRLVSGPPSVRRAFVNAALAQDSPAYYREFVRYQKTLLQKAALLRSGALERELLGVYNATLVESGTALMLARAAFIEAVASVAAECHARWSRGSERLLVAYGPNVPSEDASAQAVAERLTETLKACETAEIARGRALRGPHRDDVELRVDGVSLAAYGSQGQQRTAVLALKAGEYAVMRERSGEAPLLLLDDVLSEFDADRADAFLSSIGGYEQAFMTTTHLPPGLTEASVYRIEDGALTAMKAS